MTIVYIINYLMFLYLIGLGVNLGFFNRVNYLLLSSAAFFTGMIVWVLSLALVLSANNFFNSPVSMEISGSLCLLVGAYSYYRAVRMGVFNNRYCTKSIVIGTIFVLANAILAASMNYTVLSSDSFYMNDIAVFINNYETMGEYLGPRLASYGLFIPALMAAYSFTAVDYAYYLIPMITYQFIFNFIMICRFSALSLGVGHFKSIFLSLLISAAVFSGFFIVFTTFYVNANALAGMYLMMFFAMIWLGLRIKEVHYIYLSIIMIAAFAMLRVEAHLFISVFIVAIVTLSPDVAKFARPLIIACLFDLIWIVLLGNMIGMGSDLLQPSRLMFMGGVIIGAIFIIHISVYQRWWLITKWFPLMAVLGFISINGAFYFLNSELMSASFHALIKNMYEVARWGSVWTGMLALAMFVYVFGRELQNESVFVYSIISFFLIVLSLGYVRDFPYRLGWGDSGNRMLSHIIFVFAYYLFLKVCSSLAREQNAA